MMDKKIKDFFLNFLCNTNTFISKAKLSANYFFRFLIATKNMEMEGFCYC